MKKLIKQLVDPWLFQAMRFKTFSTIATYLAYQDKRARLRSVEARLAAEGSYLDTVVRGPFKGLVYPKGRYHGRFQKIIGSYEAETHQFLEAIIKHGNYSSTVNLGAADGYYAVAFAKFLPNTPTHAFERGEHYHSVIAHFAELNGVSQQVIMHGNGDIRTLAELSVGETPLLICDVDGAEFELMDPVRIPWLTRASILVELHEFAVPKIEATLRQRFQGTHTIQKALCCGPRYELYPELAELAFPDINALLDEDRPNLQSWLFLEPTVQAGPSQT